MLAMYCRSPVLWLGRGPYIRRVVPGREQHTHMQYSDSGSSARIVNTSVFCYVVLNASC